MRLRLTFVLAMVCSGTVAFAQPDGGLAPETPKVLPLYPSAEEDFSEDQKAFTDAETEPERLLRVRREQEARRVGPPLRPYEKHPKITYLTQVLLGTFGAGIAGVLGGNLGSVFDDGDPNKALGGLGGPAIGGVVGTWVGSGLSVWGSGALFGKEVRPEMSLLGAGAGALVGGAAGFGLAVALEDEPQMGAALAVLVTLAAEVAGAIWLGEVTLRPLTAADRGPPVRIDAP